MPLSVGASGGIAVPNPTVAVGAAILAVISYLLSTTEAGKDATEGLIDQLTFEENSDPDETEDEPSSDSSEGNGDGFKFKDPIPDCPPDLPRDELEDLKSELERSIGQREFEQGLFGGDASEHGSNHRRRIEEERQFLRQVC